MSTKLPEILRDRALAARDTESLRKAHEWVVSAAPYAIEPESRKPVAVRNRSAGRRVASLHGCTGSGKSLAASWCALFVEARPLHYGAKGAGYYHARQISTCADWKTEVWDDFDAWSIVIIDDVGTERDASRCADVIERCFNHRLGPTVLTTNLTGKELVARYGARVESRVRGEATGIACPAVDMRIEAPETEDYAKPDERTFGGAHLEPFLSLAEAERYSTALRCFDEEQRQRAAEERAAASRCVLPDFDEIAIEKRKLEVVFDEDARRRELEAQVK